MSVRQLGEAFRELKWVCACHQGWQVAEPAKGWPTWHMDTVAKLEVINNAISVIRALVISSKM